MKNMNKKFAVILVFVLAISMLMVGCGDKKTNESTTANQGAMTDVNEEVSNKEEVTVEEPATVEEQKGTTEGETTVDTNTSTSTSDTNASVSHNEGISQGVSQGTSKSTSKSTSQGISTSKGTSSSVSVSSSSGKTKSAGVSTSTNTGKKETKAEEPKPNPTPTPSATPTPTQTPTPTPEKNANGLTSLSKSELNQLLDEIYPGPNLTQEWIDKLPAEKMYEYLGKKYQDEFNGYIRKDGKVIDDSTVECNVVVELASGGTKTHKLRLQVNNNRWSVIGDEEVK